MPSWVAGCEACCCVVFTSEQLPCLYRCHACWALMTGVEEGHRYGTILCDLEKRRVVDLLPDRELRLWPGGCGNILARRP